MRIRSVVAIGCWVVLSACGRPDEQVAPAPVDPVVRTVAPVGGGAPALAVSGTVRARFETPMAFQVGGRILRRHVEAGESVSAGQLLFEIDPRDLQQAVVASQAEQAAAQTAVDTAQAEARRVAQLVSQGFLSQQAQDRALLAVQEAASRRDAVTARLTQARHGVGYAQLRAPAAGVLLDVMAQAGQVVAAGQPVATLARDGLRELEVHLPQGTPVPSAGVALLGEQRWRLRWRESAGAVDALSRTLRARYSPQADAALPLPGTVVRVEFDHPASSSPSGQAPAAVWALPLAALDERGQGARVWLVRSSGLQPVPVQVVRADAQTVQVQADLQPTDRVVSLGTHLLQEGMKVREQAQ